jgi:hypothetical protein
MAVNATEFQKLMIYTVIYINPFVKKLHKLPIRIWISRTGIYNDMPIELSVIPIDLKGKYGSLMETQKNSASIYSGIIKNLKELKKGDIMGINAAFLKWGIRTVFRGK